MRISDWSSDGFSSDRFGRPLVQNRPDGLGGARARESPLGAQHLVEHGPETEDVGARVNRLAPELFGRHVRHGPEHHAREIGSATCRERVCTYQYSWVVAGQLKKKNLHNNDQTK